MGSVFTHTSALWCILVSACAPDFAARPSQIDRRRVIAVHAEPAEVRPGAQVRYEALVVSPAGAESRPPIDWAYCTAPKPPGENGTVNTLCLGDAALLPLPSPGPTTTALVPEDACERFGPQRPAGTELRPQDPDATGGYYQPLRLVAEGELSFAAQRLRCELAAAPVAVARTYAADYQNNQNPNIAALSLTDGTVLADETTLSDNPEPNATTEPAARVQVGATVTLELSWPADSRETFLRYDPASLSLQRQEEILTVSWFATAGSFAADRSDARPTDPEPNRSRNAWTAPSSPQTVHLWVVLRDDRGGSAWTAAQVAVQ